MKEWRYTDASEMKRGTAGKGNGREVNMVPYRAVSCGRIRVVSVEGRS